MDMPEFSPDYCPDCGNELEVRQIEGTNRLYCSSCDRVEWLNPGICAGLIIQKDNKFLLQKRGITPRKGKWSIPAGFLELEETPLEAAKRETEEETGLKVTGNPDFVDHLSIKNPDGSHVIVAVFYIEYDESEGELSRDKDEVDALDFWSVEEMISQRDKLEHEDYLRLIKQIRKEKS